MARLRGQNVPSCDCTLEVVDPLTELMGRHGPYNDVFNNPLRFIDLHRMSPGDPKKVAETDKPTASEIEKKFEDGKAGKAYTLTLYITQPGEGGDRDPYEGSVIDPDVGHAFIGRKKVNDDSSVIEQIFGFYPDAEEGGHIDPLGRSVL